MLPLSGVVTEMRPAVEATNQLLGRVSASAGGGAQLHLQQRARVAHADRRRAGAGAADGIALGGTTRARVAVEASDRVDDPAVAARRAPAGPGARRGRRAAGPRVGRPRPRGAPHRRRVRPRPAPAGARARGRRSRRSGFAATSTRSDSPCAIWSRTRWSHGVGGHWIRVSTRREPRRASRWRSPTTAPACARDDLPALTQRFKRAGNAPASARVSGSPSSRCWHGACRARLGLHSPPPGLAAGFEARLIWAAPAETGS